MKITVNEVDMLVPWASLKGQSGHTQSWYSVKQWDLRETQSLSLCFFCSRRGLPEVDARNIALTFQDSQSFSEISRSQAR